MVSTHVRYPGRALVLGDHCDWAGGSTLSIPIPLGIEIVAEPATDTVTVRSELEGELLEGRWSLDVTHRPTGPLRFVAAALQTLRSAGIEPQPADLWVRSDLPAGRGFSSSAALSLALLDSLSRLAGEPLEVATLVDLAYELERNVLGVSVGRLDPAACAAAQPLYATWTPRHDGEMVMTPRRITPLVELHFVIGAFPQPRDTAAILKTLSTLFERQIPDYDGDMVRGALTDFSSAAEAGAHAMSNGQIKALGHAMTLCQNRYQDALGPRSPSLHAPRLAATCEWLLRNGAVGAKFSGAGGEGSVLSLFERENAARAAAIRLEDLGLQAWHAPVGAP